MKNGLMMELSDTFHIPKRFLHNVVDSGNVCAKMDGGEKREIIKCAG